MVFRDCIIKETAVPITVESHYLRMVAFTNLENKPTYFVSDKTDTEKEVK